MSPPRICIVSYCRRPRYTHGYCYRHFSQNGYGSTKKVYTLADFERNIKAYDRNDKKVVKSFGTPQYQMHLKRERELNRLGNDIRQDLGIKMKDPCPIKASPVKFCYNCTGWYRLLLADQKRANSAIIESSVGKGTRCPHRPRKF